jgi:hypothetical protein
MIAGSFPMVISADQAYDDGEADNVESSSRGSVRAGDFVISGNSKQTLSNINYDNLWIKDNATVYFDGANNKISGHLNVTHNASVTIKFGARVRAGLVTANCKLFNLEGGDLIVKNATSFPDHGVTSEVIIHTQKGINITEGAKITVTGTTGQASDGTKASYNGGASIIDIESDEYIRIIDRNTNDRSELSCTGGKGGNGVDSVFTGGEGGLGSIILTANGQHPDGYSIKINNSIINAIGGIGGSAGGGLMQDGSDGGPSEIKINSKSNSKISIDYSEIISTGGPRGGAAGGGINGNIGIAGVYFNCKTIYIDEYKVDGVNDGADEWLHFQIGKATIIHAAGEEGSPPYIEFIAPNHA